MASRKRAPKGTGTVFWCECRKCWIARKTVNGVRIERHGKTQAEALRKLALALPPEPAVTFSVWSARWLESLGHKQQTVDSYRDTLRLHINPRLGTRAVNSITAFDIKEAIKFWGESSHAGTVGKILTCLSGCLQGACDAEIITRNVARAVKRPVVSKVELDLFTPEELKRIIAAGLSRRTWRSFALCAATGCRIGEATALKAGDYDAATGMLSITRTLTRRHGLSTAKSKASRRVIWIPPDVRPALVAGIRNSSYANVHVFWRNLLAHLGLRYRNIHQLKHSVASILVAEGESIADAAAYMGDTFEVFARTYIHAVGTNPGATLERVLGGGKVAGESRVRAKIPGKSGL
jgi:integrase